MCALPIYIGGDQVPDSRRRDRIDVELRPEAERGEDRQLVRRVDAVDVEARVGLGITLGLRGGQCIGEARALALHQRQDIIAGAVQYAIDARDRIRRGAFADRLDRSEEHTSELQSLMRISYAVFCLKKKTKTKAQTSTQYSTPRTT